MTDTDIDNTCYMNHERKTDPVLLITITTNPLKCSGVRQLHLKVFNASRFNLHFYHAAACNAMHVIVVAILSVCQMCVL